MSHRCIHAFTEPTNEPAYINVYQDGDRYRVTVRSQGFNGQMAGVIVLTADKLRALRDDISAHLEAGN